MTVNDQLSRAADQVRSEVRDIPTPIPPSNTRRRMPVAVGVGLLSVLTVAVLGWLNPFGSGSAPSVEGSASGAVAMVHDWVEGALAGRFEEIAGLTYGEFGEPESMAELARTLHSYQSQYGKPVVDISPFETDSSFAVACIALDYGDVEVRGGIVVREWPDLGRKLWEFRNAMTGCGADSSVTTTAPAISETSRTTYSTPADAAIAYANTQEPDIEDPQVTRIIGIYADQTIVDLRVQVQADGFCYWYGVTGEVEQDELEWWGGPAQQCDG